MRCRRPALAGGLSISRCDRQAAALTSAAGVRSGACLPGPFGLHGAGMAQSPRRQHAPRRTPPQVPVSPLPAPVCVGHNHWR